MRFEWPFTDSYDWHRWYAWRPVFIGDTLVWLETLERKAIRGTIGPAHQYRYLPGARP